MAGGFGVASHGMVVRGNEMKGSAESHYNVTQEALDYVGRMTIVLEAARCKESVEGSKRVAFVDGGRGGVVDMGYEARCVAVEVIAVIELW